VSTLGPQIGKYWVFAPQFFLEHAHMDTSVIGRLQFYNMPRLVAKFGENRFRDAEKYVVGKR